MSRVNAAIICGDARDRLTQQCLSSFVHNTDPNVCDLVVLANNVSPPTERLLTDYSEHCKQIVFTRHMLGGGEVTNRVLQEARLDQGEFLYHTANDFYFHPGWLEGLLLNWPIAESLGVGLLGAYSHPYHQTNSVAPGLGGYSIHFKDMVSAGSWFMRWETWDKFGPLNELHHGNWIGSEDSEFNFRLIAAGVKRATLVPEGVVHTGRTASNGQPTLGAECMPDIEGVLIE